jgi:RNA polymerase sigma-70 factor (ECF subfamily)
VRREGVGAEDAKDITQGFFQQFLERRDWERLRQERGRFRSYLLVSLKHFLASEWRRARAEKRGGGQTLIPLDELLAEQRFGMEPVDLLSADRIFDRRWALTVLDQVLNRLGQEYATEGKIQLFEHLKQLLSDEPHRPSQASIAEKLGMTENAVKQAFHRMVTRYRQLLREEIAHTVASPGDIEAELRDLVAALRA